MPDMPAIHSILLDAYSDRLAYGFSTKDRSIGGTGLDPATADANRRYWLELFGMNEDLTAFSFPTQVHGCDFFATSAARHGNVDAILIDTLNTPAMVLSADCTPVLLYAPDIHQGAVVHCGWKSTAQELAPYMVSQLAGAGAEVSRIVAIIGPALSIDGFEIDSPVLESLELSLPEGTHRHWMRASSTAPDKFHADVPFINELQLRTAGVRHIERLAYATDTHPHLLWSHRAGDVERQGSFLELK